MDITGTWEYQEDFGFGKSAGQVELKQSNNIVSGIFTFTEEVDNDYKIDVVEKVEGTISDNKLLLKSIEVKATQNSQEINYLPNTFDIYLVSENKLVGSTFDNEDVCGVFVMERQ
ncbi:MAG: hypothetical protein MI739_06585 [Bacteroidales bacterium]|nr:hypothetical protein [Bacteroidales bacterium]